jgi:hypothetical protein
VEKYEEDVIVSSNGIFSAGFYQIGENAFSFAIWFTELQYQSHNTANIVWMANREQLVNGNVQIIAYFCILQLHNIDVYSWEFVKGSLQILLSNFFFLILNLENFQNVFYPS